MAEDLHDHVEVAELAPVRTAEGLAKKVAWPAVALVAIGAVLLIVGAIVGNDVVLGAGGAMIVASGITGGLGYQAPPPPVEHEAIPERPLGKAPRFHD